MAGNTLIEGLKGKFVDVIYTVPTINHQDCAEEVGKYRRRIGSAVI